MAAVMDDIREIDYAYVCKQLRHYYRQQRTAETPQELRHVRRHIVLWKGFLSDNGYPPYSQIHDFYIDE